MADLGSWERIVFAAWWKEKVEEEDGSKDILNFKMRGFRGLRGLHLSPLSSLNSRIALLIMTPSLDGVGLTERRWPRVPFVHLNSLCRNELT
jgi:hypothetical protein